MAKHSKAVNDQIWGNPFGVVFPRRDPPVPPLYDGRTAAMRILRKYFSELTFYRPNKKDATAPIAFSIPEEDINIEWPDDEKETEHRLPSISFLAQAQADYDANGLTTNVVEGTEDLAAPGTVLVESYEYQEDFAIEVWTQTKQERRALLLGLEASLSPLELQSGLRFVMPDYYGQLCCFELQNREMGDDEAGILRRRRARLIVKLRYNVVAPYPVNLMDPTVQVVVDADDVTGDAIEDDDEFPVPLPSLTRPKP